MSDVNGLEISDVLGLSQPLTKLIETISDGIGTLYHPVHLKRIAKARAEEIKLISAAIVDNSNLPINYQHGNVGIDSTDVQNLALRTQQRLLQEEMKKQQNMDAVVANAAEELQGKEQVSDVPVDKDWSTRFRNIVKDVSSEEMQYIWGKILAGEVENPGSFSLRTLENIRNLSQSEATVFQKIAPFLLQNGSNIFITSNTDLLSDYGIHFSDMLLLDECGLISARSMMQIKFAVSNKNRVGVYNNELIAFLVSNSDTEEIIPVGAYTLTRAGRELYAIIAHTENNECFYRVLEDVFNRNRSKNLGISIHRINHIKNGKVNYSLSVEREFKKTSGTVQ